MRVSYSQLKGQPVETESGEALGKVCDIQIDTTAYTLVAIEATRGALAKEHLIIAATQIVRFEDHKVVVRDTFVEDLARANRPGFASPSPIAPAAPRTFTHAP